MWINNLNKVWLQFLALLTEPVLECLSQEDSSIRILSTIESCVLSRVEDPHVFEDLVFVGFESIVNFDSLVDLVCPVDL